jgi:hypothetical protein
MLEIRGNPWKSVEIRAIRAIRAIRVIRVPKKAREARQGLKNDIRICGFLPNQMTKVRGKQKTRCPINCA